MPAKKTVAKKKAAPRKKAASKRKRPVKKVAIKPDPKPEVKLEPIPETPQPTSPEPEPMTETPSPSTLGEAPTIVVPEFEGEAASQVPGMDTGTPTPGPVEPTSGRVSKESFFGIFRAMFAAPNAVLAARGVPALKALYVAPENQGARNASDALYDIIAETESLRWMLDMGNNMTGRLMVIGAFVIPTVQAAAMEYRANLAEARKSTGKTVDAQPVPESKPEPKPEPETENLEAFEVEV